MKKTLNRTRRAVRGADEYEVDRSVRRDLQSNCPSAYRLRLFKAPMVVRDGAKGEVSDRGRKPGSRVTRTCWVCLHTHRRVSHE